MPNKPLLAAPPAGGSAVRIERAIQKAAQWHAGQFDKAGEAYILHPLSVMFRVRRAGHSEEVQVAAVLHDVVEDCPVDLNDIDHYFGARMVDIIDALTRREGEPYEAFIDRVKQHPVARIVKLADIDDNLDPARNSWATFGSGQMADFVRLRKRYERARVVLQGPAHAPEGAGASEGDGDAAE